MRHVEDAIKWDKDKLLNDDEIEFLMKMIKNYKQNRRGQKHEELLKMVPSMTKKGYQSIKEIYQEILTESYW